VLVRIKLEQCVIETNFNPRSAGTFEGAFEVVVINLKRWDWRPSRRVVENGGG